MLDLRSGRAVHARGGRRDFYRGVESVLYRGDDPLGLALAFRDALSLGELYCADLDAIGGGPPDLGFLRRAADEGLRLWVDAGLRDASGVAALRAAGVGTWVVATETLMGPVRLAEIVDAAGPESLVFGLDLKDGRPVLAPYSRWGTEDPAVLIDAAFSLGLHRVLILDSARIGTGQGVGSGSLVRDLLRRAPGVEISVGGGVAGKDELQALADLGVSAVLVGSALHDGRIGRSELREVGGPRPGGLADR